MVFIIGLKLVFQDLTALINAIHLLSINWEIWLKRFINLNKAYIMKKVLVTGGTGYLGSWVVKYLLESGYDVQLPVRDKSKKFKYDYLESIAEESSGKLTIWEADLLKEGSYDDAMNGCEQVFHLASPFSLTVKNPQKQLIDPALKGTKNVLTSVNNTPSVKKVVLTSSVAAIYGDSADMEEQGLKEFDESFFNTSSSLDHQPYSYSKVLAEKAAWEIQKAQSNWDLVTINPGFIMGPVLSKTSSSESLSFMKDIMKGKFSTGVPKLMMAYVDVRDVAKAHLTVAEQTEAQGRHILVNQSLSMLKVTQIVGEVFGKKYKLPKSESPKWLMVLIGPLFGVTRQFIRRNVGYDLAFNNEKSIKKIGVKYTPIRNTIEDMINSIQ